MVLGKVAGQWSDLILSSSNTVMTNELAVTEYCYNPSGFIVLAETSSQRSVLFLKTNCQSF